MAQEVISHETYEQSGENKRLKPTEGLELTRNTASEGLAAKHIPHQPAPAPDDRFAHPERWRFLF